MIELKDKYLLLTDIANVYGVKPDDVFDDADIPSHINRDTFMQTVLQTPIREIHPGFFKFRTEFMPADLDMDIKHMLINGVMFSCSTKDLKFYVQDNEISYEIIPYTRNMVLELIYWDAGVYFHKIKSSGRRNAIACYSDGAFIGYYHQDGGDRLATTLDEAMVFDTRAEADNRRNILSDEQPARFYETVAIM